MKPSHITSSPFALFCLALLSAASISSAILVQPHNFAPDEQEQEGSFFGDHDFLKLGERLRDARMLQAADAANQESAAAEAAEEHFSQEMADLIHREHQHQLEKQQASSGIGSENPGEPSLSASVAHVLMNVARAAQAANEDQQQGSASDGQQQQQQQQQAMEMSSRGSILELDTSGASAGPSAPSKADLKQSGPKQWFNPKETIPVLKISSMGEFFLPLSLSLLNNEALLLLLLLLRAA